MRGKGNIVNNKIVAELTRAAMKDAREYVRPAVLAKLRDKLGGEAYYLFLRNNPMATWKEKAEILLASCVVCEKGFSAEEWENRHNVHADDCNYPISDCDCDHFCHEKCCRQCAK